MARSYAKIHVGIWNDPDFLALDRDPMLTYQFLLEQPKMRTCGVIDMQVRRWAPKLHMTAGELLAVLAHLVDRHFIAIDDDTDELAVRTFVKHDAGDTKNWKVWIGVWSSLDAVESDFLRSFVAFHMPDGAYEPKAKPSLTRPLSIPSRSGPDPQSDTQSIEEKGDVIDSQSDTQPIPSGKSLATTDSVSATTTGPDPAHAPPDDPPASANASVVVEDVIRSIAAYQAEVAKAQGVEPDKGWPAYETGIANRVRRDDSATIADLIAQHPDRTAAQLRDAYHEPESLTSYDELIGAPR